MKANKIIEMSQEKSRQKVKLAMEESKGGVEWAKKCLNKKDSY